MNATKSKQKYMKWVRSFVRHVKNDPFLRRDVNIDDLMVEMYKWNKNSGTGVFVVYDRSRGKTLWNSEYCQWENIRFDSQFARNRMWTTVNKVVCNMRVSKTSS